VSSQKGRLSLELTYVIVRPDISKARSVATAYAIGYNEVAIVQSVLHASPRKTVQLAIDMYLNPIEITCIDSIFFQKAVFCSGILS
jgi:hypothetical protein